jgi:hypothetical protein
MVRVRVIQDMRRPLSILAVVGIVAMCALLVMSFLLPVFIPTSRFIRIGGIGPVGLRLFRFGFQLTWRNSLWFWIPPAYPAALIGAPSLIYLMFNSARDRRNKKAIGFPVEQKTEC